MDLAFGVKDIESIVTIDGTAYTDYVFENSLSGYIYIIKNKLSGRAYIGQTSDLKQRINSHKKDLMNFSHENEEMVLDCFLFGIDSFSFDVICFISSSENILETELNFIKFFNSYYPTGYNLLVGRQPKYQDMSSRKIHELSYSEIKDIRDMRLREFNKVSANYSDFFNCGNQEMKWIIKNKIYKGIDGKIKVNYLLGKDYIHRVLKQMDGLSFSENSKEAISIISEFSIRRKVSYENLHLSDVADWLNKIFPSIPYLLVKTESNNWAVIDINYEKIIELIESKLERRFYKEEIENFRKEFLHLYKNCGKRKSYARFMGMNQLKKLMKEIGLNYRLESYRDNHVERRKETYWYISKI